LAAFYCRQCALVKEAPINPENRQQSSDLNEASEPAIISESKSPGDNADMTVGGTEVKLLAFDMGKVFVDFQWEVVCKGFCERSAMAMEEFRVVLKYAATLGYEHGRITTEEFVAALNRKIGSQISLEEFLELWVVSYEENQQMAALLEALSKRLPLYVVSNTNEAHHSYLQRRFNVERHFKEKLYSYQIGSCKPEPEIYLEIMRRSGLPAEQCLFIDDLEQNVAAARELGMQVVRFVGIEDLKTELAIRKIEF